MQSDCAQIIKSTRRPCGEPVAGAKRRARRRERNHYSLHSVGHPSVSEREEDHACYIVGVLDIGWHSQREQREIVTDDGESREKRPRTRPSISASADAPTTTSTSFLSDKHPIHYCIMFHHFSHSIPSNLHFPKLNASMTTTHDAM